MAADEPNAQPVLQDMAARTEQHPISALTLSDKQFLRGDANGKATTTSGQLRLARNLGRLPVVVLQHGSAGMAPNVEMRARELNAIDISTFALDGFTGRGLTEVNTKQALLSRLNFMPVAARLLLHSGHGQDSRNPLTALTTFAALLAASITA